MEKKSFIAKDGKEIKYKEWRPENPKALLQISHGLSESTVRYEEFAEFMAGNGFLVFADDHRGHGDTDNCSGYCDGDMFFDTLSDLAELSRKYKAEYPDLKLILFGHSFGSFLTQAYIENYGELADGFIVGGSAFMKGLKITAGKFVASFNCLFGKKKKPAKLITDLSFEVYNRKYKDGTTIISSVKEECDKYIANPHCGFPMSNGFYKSMFTAFGTLYKKKSIEKIDVDKPILLISGRDDPVGEFGTSVKKLYRFYADKVGVKAVEMVLYDGVRHEYLNDTSRIKAREKILDFCNGVAEEDKTE